MYCVCTVSLLSIIIIFTTDNFVKHKCSQDIIVVYSGVTTTQQECHIETEVECSLDRVGV